MNISLTRELEEYVVAQVKTGHYTSASEVVREALRNQIRQSMVQQLDQRVSAGRQQVADGRLVPANRDYFEGKRKRIQQYMDDDASA